MASPEHESLLPRVEETDLLDGVFEDITDPTHERRWRDFAATNPILAREILRRAQTKVQLLSAEHALDQQKLMIDIVTFAMRALEFAALRQATGKHYELDVATVGDDGEARPPSA